jgi:hypothetical protein
LSFPAYSDVSQESWFTGQRKSSCHGYCSTQVCKKEARREEDQRVQETEGCTKGQKVFEKGDLVILTVVPKLTSVVQAHKENEIKIAEQRQRIKEQNMEIERLKANATHRSAPDDSSDEEEHITKKKRTNKEDNGALKTQALHAGKRYAVCNSLWISPAVLGYLALQAKSDSGSDTESESEDSAELKEQAAAIYNAIVPPLRPHVGSRWFSKRVYNIIIISFQCLSDDFF